MKLIEFTGARRIPLIGRRDLLQEVERRIGRGGVHLVYFEGAGGIGKTALLQAILEQSQRGSRADAMAGCCVAHEIIDLYHIDVHSVEGLIRRLTEVLGRWFFEQTHSVLTALDRARVAGDGDVVRKHARTLEPTFLHEFSALTDAGVVLAFDTLETLPVEQDPFHENLGQDAPVFTTGRWLFQSFLPALRGNVVVLLAGRPDETAAKLEVLHRQSPHTVIRHVPLEALDEDESREYLRAVAQAEGRHGDGDAATRLWTCAEQRGDVVHLLTEGRPILLALVADMVARGWALPPPFDQTLERRKGQEDRQRQAAIEKALVVAVQASPTPLGETLRTLAWLRKGATPELLAQVMGIQTADGEWDVYTAAGYLDQIAQLALVKVRPGDRRVFLHDEMYTLLEKHVLRKSNPEERDQIYSAVQTYYRDLTRDLERRSEQLPPELASAQSHWRQALVEEMHYRLLYSPPVGFAMASWLAEEALLGRDSEMDMWVRAEFLRTLALLKEQDQIAAPLLREMEADIAVHWGMRALFLQGNPDAALSIFDQVRRRWGRQAGKLGLAWTHLQLWRAVARIQQGREDDWLEARDQLLGVVKATDEVLLTPPENPVVKARRWRAKLLKALALNYLGYLDRQQGRYLEAVRHYQESAMLQRRLSMAALAPTLTNLSYVMTLTGSAHHARLLAEEAERLARRKGKQHLLALTLNVRALVEAHDDRHRTALRYADRALETAAELPSQQVRGLISLTRARVHRYLCNSFTDGDRRLTPTLFDEALKEANQAASLLRDSPADRVDALLERGCIYRELARLHHADGKTGEADDIAKLSRIDLERVTLLAAAINLPRQQALAWTELGWLFYYLGQVGEAQQALEQAYLVFPAGYLFPNRGPLPPMALPERKSEATLPYWSTLGKAEMLRAYLSLDQARAASGKDGAVHLQTAVKHLTLSLAYNELIAGTCFDLARAEESLHRRIIHDRLSIKALHQYAGQVAETQGLQPPTHLQTFLSRMFGSAELWS